MTEIGAVSPSVKSLNVESLKRVLERAADLILAETENLTHADQAIGDGDHGIGMARGFTAVKAVLPTSGPSVTAVLEAVGKTLMLKVGGSSGAIFGTMFIAGSKALPNVALEGSVADSLDAEGLARFLEAGLEGVQKRGNAKPGDKTMVDALAPAAAVARVIANRAGASVTECLHGAAQAAWNGMEQTRDMVATLGRAKTLGDRARGHLDPGAMSMAFLLKGMSASQI